MSGSRFVWDSNKAGSHLRKHGISFCEAKTLFEDPDELMLPDPDHSMEEERFISIGRAASGVLMLACYTENEEAQCSWRDTVRGQGVSAREMMREEYDLSNAVEGRHAERYAAGTEVWIDGKRVEASSGADFVNLDPDVKQAFPDDESVNEVLRMLLKAAKNIQDLPKAS